MSNDRHDIAEAFLQANAQPEIIADQLADVLRNVMRAVASRDPSAAIWRATEQLQHAIELIRRCKDPLTVQDLLTNVVAAVSDIETRDELYAAYVDAAHAGMRYLVEMSASDGAARGRASKRLDEFRGDIDEIERIREERRRKHGGPIRRSR